MTSLHMLTFLQLTKQNFFFSTVLSKFSATTGKIEPKAFLQDVDTLVAHKMRVGHLFLHWEHALPSSPELQPCKHLHIQPYWISHSVLQPNLPKERSFREPHTQSEAFTPFSSSSSSSAVPLISGPEWGGNRPSRSNTAGDLQPNNKDSFYSEAMLIGVLLKQSSFEMFITWGAGRRLRTKCAQREWPGQCWAGWPCRSWWCLGPWKDGSTWDRRSVNKLNSKTLSFESLMHQKCLVKEYLHVFIMKL